MENFEIKNTKLNRKNSETETEPKNVQEKTVRLDRKSPARNRLRLVR